ncbi:MAG TPA: hypothetical protein VFS21_06185 [Roseiflexaceae bacterium]|nr:hypothetical protein [Roseiflexaceae bacterium]
MQASHLVLTGPELSRLLYQLDACPEAHEWVYGHEHLDSLALYTRAPAGWIIWLGAMFGRPEALGAVVKLAALWLAGQPQTDAEVIAALLVVDVVARWRQGLETEESLRVAHTAACERWTGTHPTHDGSPAQHVARCVAQAAWAANQGENGSAASWADDAVKALCYGAPLDDLATAVLTRHHLPYDMLAACVRPILRDIRGA